MSGLPSRALRPFAVLCLMLMSFLAVAAAADWPHTRGPALDGRAPDASLFGDEGLALDVAWRVPLGSGYSGIVVAGDRAVTLYSEGESDWAGAFSVDNGKRLWRHRLGDRYVGVDGSDDGPLSSPVIHAGHAFALAPGGRLVALRLNNGDEVWSRQIEQDLGAVKPSFGFTTTPVIAGTDATGHVLVVQAGGAAGHAIVGLDPSTGATRWAHNDDTVSYQSPIVMDLAGQLQVVAVSDSRIEGLAASSGDVLWQHPLGDDRSNSAVPSFIGEDRFLIPLAGGVAAFRVSQEGGQYTIAELYRSNALGRTYAPPVYYQGHVYGIRGTILTCMKADDGSRVWRSRPPGGESLVLVDGHLVIFAAGGTVVVAEATPKGYFERGRATAIEGASLTWPSYAGGRVFVRNLVEMAAVSMTGGGAPTRTADAAMTADSADHAFGQWLSELAGADDKQAMIAALLAKHAGGPIVEGGFVHFLFRSNAQDVAIAGSMLDSGTATPMHHAAGTDLFHRSFELTPATRWEYRFQIDFEKWETDPRNPRSVPTMGGRGEFSELVLDGYRVAEHHGAPSTPVGKQETFTLKSEALGVDKEVTVWLPPGYDSTGEPYPLLIVSEGPAWRDQGLLMNSLDNLVGKEVAPVVVAFIESSRAWWEESGGSKNDAYVGMQADELVPALEKRYHLATDAAARGVLGLRYYGSSAISAALERSDVFGKAAMLSPHLGHGVHGAISESIRAGKGKGAALYLDWNRFDEQNRDRGHSFGQQARTLANELRAGGYAFTGGEMLDSGGWGGWRNRSDRFLRALFPLD